MVVRLAPSACTANMLQLFTALPSSSTVHAPQSEVSQPMCDPVSPATSRRQWIRSSLGSTSGEDFFPLIVRLIFMSGLQNVGIPSHAAMQAALEISNLT